MHGPTSDGLSPAADRHCGVHSRQLVGLSCQPCANASRITEAAASPRPLYSEGRRANPYTAWSTDCRPMVTWNPGEILSARPTASAPECGAPITKTGWVTLRELTMRIWRGGIYPFSFRCPQYRTRCPDP